MLTDEDRAVLDIEGRHWRYAAHKEVAVRAMGLSPTRYYQRLAALMRDPAAAEYAPVTVARMRAVTRRRRAG